MKFRTLIFTTGYYPLIVEASTVEEAASLALSQLDTSIPLTQDEGPILNLMVDPLNSEGDADPTHPSFETHYSSFESNLLTNHPQLFEQLENLISYLRASDDIMAAGGTPLLRTILRLESYVSGMLPSSNPLSEWNSRNSLPDQPAPSVNSPSTPSPEDTTESPPTTSPTP